MDEISNAAGFNKTADSVSLKEIFRCFKKKVEEELR